MFYRIFFALGLAAVAAAHPAAESGCPTICIDGVNPCGTRFGGCYPACSTQLKPTPPPCTASTTSSTTSSTASCTLTGTVCEDHLKTCGSPVPTATLTYGGCHPACEKPTFITPTCPTPTPEITIS
ncbi:hypothetical protein F4779DRAFT_584523 [Xylariaceae sp. FL0662B]|nr:hypothetical protein F4779DRAFT_584523 [Xylariaceae sp. FL0662B]